MGNCLRRKEKSVRTDFLLMTLETAIKKLHAYASEERSKKAWGLDSGAMRTLDTDRSPVGTGRQKTNI